MKSFFIYPTDNYDIHGLIEKCSRKKLKGRKSYGLVVGLFVQ
jgi:hypothetical protein